MSVSTTLNAGYWSFEYDANGNRTRATVSGSTSNYTIAATGNRIAGITNPARSFAYDNAGNTTADGSFTAGYDLPGRMRTLAKAGVTTTYAYDGMGKRMRKFGSTGAASTVIFVYDQNQQLLGEYSSTGAAIREYVWLGSTPIAVFQPDPANAAGAPLVYYIHADHLDTPRVAMDRAGNVRWRWMAEPFGTTAAETSPAGLPALVQNLRFPGQYFDQESGLHYNMARYYDSGNGGRYTQPDPLGLDGGSRSLYTYAGGDPTGYIDPDGRQVTVPGPMGIPVPLPLPVAPSAPPLPPSVSDMPPITKGPHLPSWSDFPATRIPAFEAFRFAIDLGTAICSTGSGDGFWQGLKPYRGKTKTNGESGSRRRYFEWDHTHGDVEVYNGRGEHLGSANPASGEMTKPPVNGRRINI